MVIEIKLDKQNIVNDVAAELNLYGRTLELSANTDGQESVNLRELANYIRTPDDNDTKPIVARAMQESWNTVKETCQRYYVAGRHYDDNRLEAITQVSETNGYIDGSALQNDTSFLFYISQKAGVTYRIALDFSDVSNNAGAYNILVNGEVCRSLNINTGTGKIELNYLAKSDDMVSVELAKADSSSNTIELSASKIDYSYSCNQFTVYVLHLDMPDNYNISVTSSITSHAHRLIVDSVVAAVLKNQQQEGYTKYLATAETARLALLRSLQARNSFGRVQHDWM